MTIEVDREAEGAERAHARGPVLSEALREFWHPVAWSRELTDQPLAVQLLGEPLVLWRSGGEIAAFYDLCIHRGTPLSLGWVSGGQLVCAYHGWHYDGSGSCTWIPSLPPGRSIPTKARATAYLVQERYELVWVCLAERPRAGIPDFPFEYDDPAYQLAPRRADATLQCNAARFLENMMDTAHFPWTHPDVLGVRDKPVVQPVTIAPIEGGFQFDSEEPIGGTMMEVDQPIRRHYELIMPFWLLFRGWQSNRPERQAMWFACCPVTSTVTRFFQFGFTNYEPSQAQRELGSVIQAQDRRIVESQRPEELPLDLSEELHLRGPDAAAVEYRRRLRELGVNWE